MLKRLIALPMFLMIAVLCVTAPAPANAGDMFICHDHPNGTEVPPTYGLRLDDLLTNGEYTFSFDYPGASVMLSYDPMTGDIHIFGNAYGGKDIGGTWDATEQGWIVIDFTYRDNVQESDDCAGAPGNDLYVTAISANNNGTITLNGWGGDQVFNFSDKDDGDCSFKFDNDWDSKGNNTIANNPGVWSAAGWLMPPTSGSRDWLFIAEMAPVPTEDKTWGAVKQLYQQ